MKKKLLGIMLLIAGLCLTVQAGSWIVDGNSQWTNTASWSGGRPNSDGATALITNNITDNRTIDVSFQQAIVGTLIIGDADGTHSFLLEGNRTNVFKNTATGVATLTQTATSAGDTIAKIAVADSALTITNLSTTKDLTIGSIAGGSNITADASAGGYVVFTGANADYSGKTTIQGGTLQVGGVAINGTTMGSGEVAINSGGILRLARNNGYSYNNTISGDGSVVFVTSNSNIHALAGNSSYSGGTLIQEGNVGVSSVNAFGTGAVILSTNTSLSLRTNMANGLVISGQGGATLVIDDTTTTNGVFSREVGTLSISNQTLSIINNEGAGSEIKVLGSTTLQGTPTFATGGGTLNLAGGIQDGGNNFGINKSGSGTLIVGAASTYGGNTLIERGTIKVGVDNALPAGAILNIGSSTTGTTSRLELEGNDLTIAGLQSVGNNTRDVRNTNSSLSTLTINTANGTKHEYLSNITGPGDIALVKTGSGTQIFSRATSYAKNPVSLDVNGGTLIWDVWGSTGMVTTVGTGGTLGGTGVLDAAVTVAGNLKPGNTGSPVGTMTCNGALTLEPTAALTLEIVSASVCDVLKNDGNDTITFNTGANIIFDFTGNTTVSNGSTYAVLQTWSSVVTNGATFTAVGLDTNLSLDTSALASSGILAVSLAAPSEQYTTNGTPYSWLDLYGLTNYVADDVLDQDLDGLKTWQEYIAGTDPTNKTSVLKAAQTVRNVVTWSPVTGRTYSVYWSTNLVKGFTNLADNIVYPQGSHTNALPDARVNHYQIKVRLP